LEISGCDKSTPLNGISSRDSKKEEARRREINKNGLPPLSIGVESSIFFFNDCWGLHQNELGGTKASTRWERKYTEVFFSSTCSLLNDDGSSSICLLALVCALISSSEVLHLIKVKRKKDNKNVEATKEKPN
jgi:hypothetical protein